MNTSRLHLRFDASAVLAHALARVAPRAGRFDTAVDPAWLLLSAALVAVAVLMLALWLSEPGSVRLS